MVFAFSYFQLVRSLSPIATCHPNSIRHFPGALMFRLPFLAVRPRSPNGLAASHWSREAGGCGRTFELQWSNSRNDKY